MEATAIIDFDRKNRIFTATSKELSPYEVEGEGETVYEAVEEFIFHIQDDIEYYEMYGQVNGLPDTRNLYNLKLCFKHKCTLEGCQVVPHSCQHNVGASSWTKGQGWS